MNGVTVTIGKLDSLICMLCGNNLRQPTTLRCQHFFCKSCVEEIPPVVPDSNNNNSTTRRGPKNGNGKGYECPVCKDITPVHDVKQMNFAQEVLETIDESKKKPRLCEKCNTKEPSFRCVDCKEIFCNGCRKQHDSWSIMKHHKWEPTDGDTTPVIDRHVFCDKHPKEVVKLYCSDCRQLICLLCYAGEHKHHSADTIDDTLDRTLPGMRIYWESVERKISDNEHALASIRKQAEELMSGYLDIKRDIRTKCEQVIEKVRDDAHKAIEQLTDVQTQQMADIEEYEKEVEMRLKSQRNIASLTDTTLSVAKGTSLLQTMQLDVIPSLVAHSKDDALSQSHVNTLRAKFVPKTATETNMVGTIVEVYSDSQSMLIGNTLSDVAKGRYTLTKEVKTPHVFSRFAKIESELWCVAHESSIIFICSLDGVKQRSIQIENIGKCRSVAKLGDHHFLVAASRGIYLADMQEVKTRCLILGDICDVSLKGGLIYTLDNAQGQVCVMGLNQKRDKYIQRFRFSIKNYIQNSMNTLQATPEYLYIALYSGHSILQYSQDGIFLKSFGTWGKALDQICNPILCGVDAKDILLVADRFNGRLKILSGNGEWKVLNVENLFEPACAAMENGKLLVMQWNRTFKQYIFQ